MFSHWPIKCERLDFHQRDLLFDADASFDGGKMQKKHIVCTFEWQFPCRYMQIVDVNKARVSICINWCATNPI